MLATLLLLGACADDAWTPPGDAGGLGDGGDASLDGAANADAESPATSAEIPEGFDELIAYQMDVGGCAGVAASIVTPSGIAWSGYYGFADIESARPVDDSSLFIVASVSKTITTLAALQLVDEGLLDLDAAADDHLPYALRHPDFAADDISARMLMTHTSGLLDTFTTLSRATSMSDPSVGLGEFSENYVTPGGAYFATSNWGGRPGSDHEYCNANFALVGHLVESVRGEDLRTISAARIFGPLGMTSTGWFLEDVDAENLATLYTYNGRTNAVVPNSGFAYYPAASLRTNIPDISRFMQATLRDGELDGTRVLSADLSRSMRSVQRRDLHSGQAITWRYQIIGGEEWLAQTGSTFGASAIAAYRPDDGVGMVVMTNSDAFIRARLGLPASRDALEQIFARIATESVEFR
ncbi:MAG: beta-lactamase family protein [Deltaproteobacteria bacterium]|nr:beta-lactamase family protein [Deltaproteobacteria bacterium]